MNEYGGYNQWELVQGEDEFAVRDWYVSARAALHHCLRTACVRAVAVPDYICSAVDDAIAEAGVEAHLYQLDEQLLPASGAQLQSVDAVIYPNYFGVHTGQVEQVRKLIGEDVCLIADNAHALFSSRGSADWAIYSPRKFVGLADGGMLEPALNEGQRPATRDTGSGRRIDHLCLRTLHGAQAGYQAFRRAEQSLSDTTPRRVSVVTECMAGGIDYKTVRDRRTVNFDRLHAYLNDSNRLQINRDHDEVPLYYPYWIQGGAGARVREQLIKHSVYVPELWPEVEKKGPRAGIGNLLREDLLCLPIDQRLSVQDIDRLASILKRVIG